MMALLAEDRPTYTAEDERVTGFGCAFCGDGGAMLIGRPGTRVIFDTCQTCFDALHRATARTPTPRAHWLRRDNRLMGG